MIAPAPPTPGTPMPVLFVGHGSPMNAIQDTPWAQGFAALAEDIPTPSAILAVSAHWYLDGTFLTGNTTPRTIHDFGGFPEALYQVRYPAPGDPELAGRVRNLLGAERAALRDDWGLDHGTWSVLLRMYPQARIPVVQLSIHQRLAPRGHAALGRALAPLRDEGVLIFASGNVTHNLQDAFRRARGPLETPDWARRFDDRVTQAARDRDLDRLIALGNSDDGRLAHPTPDHFLPMVYAFAAAHPDDPVTFPIQGFELGSLSMRAIRFG